jgi:dienelactone hydrolase
MVVHSSPNGAPIALTVYREAYHGFDVRLLQPGIRYLGHWLEYNEAAAKNAEEKTCAFLAANLGGAGVPIGSPR